MAKKDSQSSSIRQWTKLVGVNLLLAFVIGICLVTGVLLALKAYTHHGEEVEVPQVIGLYPHEAEVLLRQSDLSLVVYDSTYTDKMPLGTIVEQTPPVDAKAKRNRTVYVLLNANALPQVVLPELHDMSYRQTVNILKNIGLKVAQEPIYEPSEYRDLVLDIRRGSESLEAGSRLEQGTEVTVVIGAGKGTTKVTVPDLLGKNIADLRSFLLAVHLVPGALIYDEDLTEDNREQMVVYRQEPAPGTILYEGSPINLWLSTDIEKSVMQDNRAQEEDFF